MVLIREQNFNYMKNILIRNIRVLNLYIHQLDKVIENSFTYPDKLDIYIKIRSEILLDIIELSKQLNKEKQWKDYGKNSLGSNTSQNTTYLD